MSAIHQSDSADLDSILAALYACISGPVGQDRDWERFRRLLDPAARLMRTELSEGDGSSLKRFGVQEFIDQASGRFMDMSFYEREIARRVDRFGHVAQVFSTYESSSSPDGSPDIGRGINSIQLWHDGTRWWVMSILWDNETPESAIPDEYLP